MTQACKYHCGAAQICLPITKAILILIMEEVKVWFTKLNQPYLEVLYQAIFAAGYFGLLRIGEVTSGDHPVLARNVHIGLNKKKILFILWTSKTHWTNVKP